MKESAGEEKEQAQFRANSAKEEMVEAKILPGAEWSMVT
jgi:hypothetical protein